MRRRRNRPRIKSALSPSGQSSAVPWRKPGPRASKNQGAPYNALDLGPLTRAAQDRVKSGCYASVSEVVRAGLRALDREEALLDELLKARIAETLADTRPVQPAEDVRTALAARHARRTSKPA